MTKFKGHSRIVGPPYRTCFMSTILVPRILRCFLDFWGYLYTVLLAGSSVGIATDYGLDGPGIESRWGEIFRPSGPGAHPASCTMGNRSFPGVKYGRGVLLNTHPLLVPRSWKSRAIPLLSLWATPRPVTETVYLYSFIDIIGLITTHRIDQFRIFEAVSQQ